MTQEELYKQETGRDAKNFRGGYSTGEKFDWLEAYTRENFILSIMAMVME